MKHQRIVITKPGGPEVLQILEEDAPEPRDGEVRVKVLAAGIARADLMMRMGQYPDSVPPYPYSPGYDIAGVVDRVGTGSSRFAIGDKVAAMSKTGGYAQYLCLPEIALVSFQKQLDPAQVVCLVLNGLTAYQMLHRYAELRAGRKALFHAAASGVGTIQLQLGRLLDLEMYATASKGKHSVLFDYGAQAIEYQREDFVRRVRELTGNGVDAVFDPVGGSHLWRSFRTLKHEGHLVAYGEMAVTGPQKPKRSEVFWQHHLPRWLNVLPGGRTVRFYEAYDDVICHPDWYREDLSTLMDLLAQGKIEPVIAGRISMAEVPGAHVQLENAQVSGKFVILPWD